MESGLSPAFFPRERSRVRYLLAIAIVIAAGLASRRFPDLLPAALGQYPGDVLWALMVFLGFGFLFPRASSGKAALCALVFSTVIEFLKLCSWPWLVQLRMTLPGRLVFGQVFGWPNLVAYVFGIALGFFGELVMSRHQSR